MVPEGRMTSHLLAKDQKCPGNIGHMWGIPLNVQKAQTLQGQEILIKALLMKVKDQRSAKEC